MDKSEPAPPVTDTPPAAERPKTVAGWFAANFLPILFVVAVVGLIVWRDLDIWPVALAVLGLGLVIFIHELGHFLAAKLCDVHVETFSIGFGKAIPGCQFRYGETTYKIGWIPLGGYVKMVGEGDNADTEEADEDPRSFKNKSVGQRMIIISAGVIMNLILGCICFMVAYSHGVEETPATVGGVTVGSPAWQEDLQIGDRITQIDRITKPTFDDIRPTVMSAPKGEPIPFTVQERAGTQRQVQLVPRRNPEDLYPMVGIQPSDQLVLNKKRPGGPPPVRKGSPAAAAKEPGGSGFQGGDRIVASSWDPRNPEDVRGIGPDARDSGGSKPDAYQFLLNQFRMRGQEMIVRVDRDEERLDFRVPPAWTRVFPGVRFQMGRIAALRSTGPAARAVAVNAPGEPGLQVATIDDPAAGDKIIAIEINHPKEGKVRFVDEPSKEPEKGVQERRFDPLRLGYDLEKWAEDANDLTVRMTVLRAGAKAAKRVTFDLKWDPALVFNGEAILGASAPMAISGLGLAYFVETTVDAADANGPTGLKKGDVITEIRFREIDDKGKLISDEWLPLKQYQGAYLHILIQFAQVPEFDLKVSRAGGTEEIRVAAVEDPNWAAVDRGLRFPYDSQLQKAEDPWDALGMGLHRTWRTVKVIYQTLYATIFRQISAKTMSGPLSIANASYKIAGYDFWQFIIFIGLININLAVVNFLPIPLLDGGHMVFLIYEKVRGKPPPEKLVEWSLWVGLALILALMVFVIYLDVRKLFL
ncbi:MAG TPA: RIP metalloprotease RseP [Gemmataceae bacterium]|nr:RIP metalloprotease RseP [Gemmataceae bacterium]